jgi:hypothetical protein
MSSIPGGLLWLCAGAGRLAYGVSWTREANRFEDACRRRAIPELQIGRFVPKLLVCGRNYRSQRYLLRLLVGSKGIKVVYAGVPLF